MRSNFAGSNPLSFSFHFLFTLFSPSTEKKKQNGFVRATWKLEISVMFLNKFYTKFLRSKDCSRYAIFISKNLWQSLLELFKSKHKREFQKLIFKILTELLKKNGLCHSKKSIRRMIQQGKINKLQINSQRQNIICK